MISSTLIGIIDFKKDDQHLNIGEGRNEVLGIILA
jgi:hypothetical protein